MISTVLINPSSIAFIVPALILLYNRNHLLSLHTSFYIVPYK